MKNNKILHTLIALLILASFASCKKLTEGPLDQAQNRLLGTWTITQIRTYSTDTLGKILDDTLEKNLGTVTFKPTNPDGEKADYFRAAIFNGPCINTHLVGYFKSQAAGDPTTDGGWRLHFDPDPDDMLLQIWGIGPLTSYHIVLTTTYTSADRMQWNYILRTPGVNLRQFYTWSLER